MYTFAVVASKGGLLARGAVDILEQAAPPELPFTPRSHVTWHDDAAGVWYGGWQAEELLGIGPRWTIDPAGLTAFGGFLWADGLAWSRDEDWSPQLARRFSVTPLQQLAPDLDGVFSAVSIDRSGHGCVAADALGMNLLYRGETSDFVVVSNRASLVARFLAKPRHGPRRSITGAAWMAYASIMQAGQTGFDGVEVIPQGAQVMVSPKAPLVVKPWSAIPWLGEQPLPEGQWPDAIAEITSSVARKLTLAAQIPADIHIFELTGGHDARLILAIAAQAGLAHHFVYDTWGSPTLPDVMVAKQLAEVLDLEHEAGGARRRSSVARPADPDRALAQPNQALDPLSFEAGFRHHVWASDGARSYFDQVRPTWDSSPNVSLSGIFGESMRSVHARTRGVRNAADIRAYVTNGELHRDAAHLLVPEVRASLDQQVIAQIMASYDDSRPAQDAFDTYYLSARLRSWFGSGHELDHRNRVYPLHSMASVKTAFALGTDARRAERIAFEATRSANLRLAQMPFAELGWPADTVAGVPNSERYPTSPSGPAWSHRTTATRRRWDNDLRPRVARVARRVRGKPISTNTVEVAMARDVHQQIPVLQQFLDLGPNHELFDVVDRFAARRAIANLASAGPHQRRAVYDLATAAVWLSGQDAPGPRPRLPSAPR